MKKLCTAILVLGMTSLVSAVEIAPGGLPTLPPQKPVWAGVMMLIVGGLFVGAATIGPLVAILMPTEPEPVAHDDHDADDHGHGHGGHGH